MRRIFLGIFFPICLISAFGIAVGRLHKTGETLSVASVAYAEPLFVVGEQRPVLSAPAWVLFDVQTGETLIEEESGTVRPIASVSKLVTALVAHAHLEPSGTTSVSAIAIATEGKAGRLTEGEVLSHRELLFPLLLESSNDAAEVLAGAAGDRHAFISELNQTAESIELRQTHFEDPTGLSPQNTSSASDLAVLLRHIFLHARHLLDISTLPYYIGENHEWVNNDPVVHEEGYLGGKHGYTPEAGRTFAGIFEGRFAEGARPVGIVLLGSKDIKKDVILLRTFLETSVSYTVVR